MISTTVHRKHLRIPARKIRLLMNLVRGLPALSAYDQMKYQPKNGAKDVGLLIKSGIASAKLKGASEDKLFIKQSFADQGATLKRRWKRARGQSTQIRKEFSHLTIELAEKEDQKKPVEGVSQVKTTKRK